MEEVPFCSACKRPLQFNKPSCVYCGRKLTEEETKRLAQQYDKEKIRQAIRKAEVQLEGAIEPMIKRRQKLFFKVTIVIVSILMMFATVWISGWDPVLSAVGICFFSIPIWHVWKKL